MKRLAVVVVLLVSLMFVGVSIWFVVKDKSALGGAQLGEESILRAVPPSATYVGEGQGNRGCAYDIQSPAGRTLWYNYTGDPKVVSDFYKGVALSEGWTQDALPSPAEKEITELFAAHKMRAGERITFNASLRTDGETMLYVGVSGRPASGKRC